MKKEINRSFLRIREDSEDIIVKNWEKFANLETPRELGPPLTIEGIKKDLSEWLDDDGNLVLRKGQEDYRFAFINEWLFLFNDDVWFYRGVFSTPLSY